VIEHVVRSPWQSVCEVVREAILTGDLPPGARLVETDLALRLGTSRGPIRTALKELERTGLVIHHPRRGTFVRSLSDDDIEEILSLWDLIYPFAVRRAVLRMTSEDLETLCELVPRPPEMLSMEELIQSSLRYHRALFGFAGHRRLLDIWDNLTTQAQHRLVVASAAEKRRALRLNPIPEIHAALAARDAETAIRVSMIWSERMRRVLRGEERSSSGDAGSVQALSG
jgi:DNA-binding GntR family transcriptional regulator